MNAHLKFAFQEEAAKTRDALGLPVRSQEAWRYVNTEQLGKVFNEGETSSEVFTIDAARLQAEMVDDSSYVILLESGKVNMVLSALEGLGELLELRTLSELDQELANEIVDQMSKSIQGDFFAADNLASTDDVTCLILKENCRLDKPLQIIVNGGSDDRVARQRFHILLESCSSMQVSLKFISRVPKSTLSSTEVTCTLLKGAQLEMVSQQYDSEESVHLGGYHVRQHRDSRLKLVSLSRGAEVCRHRMQVDLLEENAHAELCGGLDIQGQSTVHTFLEINHLAPHCTSRQLFKNILRDCSKTSFDGTVYVKEHAQKTNAAQLNKNLILSDQARASTKPRLKIYADDVVCTHGATVGQIDEDEVFYLQTRGFDEKTAKELLAFGFIREVIEEVPVEGVKKDWMKIFQGERHDR